MPVHYEKPLVVAGRVPMRFHGSRRARVIPLLMLLVVGALLWRAGVEAFRDAQQRLMPTLVATLEERLGRRVAYDRVDASRAGRLVVEGVRVSRGADWSEGRLLEVGRAEMRFNPLLTAWQTYWRATPIRDTGATLTATAVTLYRPLPFPAGRALEAAGVEVSLDLAPLLAGGTDPLPGVRSVTLQEPRFALTRLPDRTWDLERLLRSGQRRPTAFRGVIRAYGAAVAVTDFSPGSLPPPARNAVAGDLTLSYAAYPVVSFSGGGRVLGERGGPFRAAGHREARTRKWYATVEGETERLPYWFGYFVRNPEGLRPMAGAGRVRAVVWEDRKDGDDRPDFRLTARLRGAGGKLEALPEAFEAFEGEVTAEPDRVWAEGRARVAGMPVRITGSQSFGAVRLGRWEVASESATVPALQAVFPRLTVPEGLRVARPLRVTATAALSDRTWRVSGQVNARSARWERVVLPAVDASFRAVLTADAPPSVAGEFRAARARLPDFLATDLQGSYVAGEERIRARGRFAALGGGVSLTAWIAPREEEPRFYLEGEAEGVDLAVLPWQREGWPLSGSARGRFIASGTPAKPLVTAHVQADEVRLREDRLAGLSARVRYAAGTVVVEQAVADDPRGRVTAHGEVHLEPLTLALEVEGRGLDLAPWLKGRTKEPAGGQSWVRASVRGTPDELEVRGLAQIYAPRWGDRTADYAEAAFAATGGDSVQLSAVKLIRHPATAAAETLSLTRAAGAAGSAADGRPWQVAGEMEVRGLTVNQALALAGSEGQVTEAALSGDFEALQLRLEGSVDAPRVAFDARVAEAAVEGLPLGDVRAAGDWDPAAGRLALATLEVRSPLGEAEGQGTVLRAADGPAETRWRRAALDFTGEIRGADLARVAAAVLPDAPWRREVAGAARASLRVGGTAGAPTANLTEVGVTDLRVAGVALTPAPFSAAWVQGALVVRDLRVAVGEGSVAAPWVALRPAPRPGEAALLRHGAVTVNRLPAEQVLALAERFPLDARSAASWEERLTALERWAGWEQAVISGTLGPGAAGTADPRASLDAPPPELRGEARVTGLRLALGGRPEAEARGQFTLAPERQDLRAFTLTATDGLTLELFGTRAVAPDPALQLAGRLRGFDLAGLERLPDAAWVDRLRPLQPVGGRAELSFTVAGTEAAPEVTFGGRVSEPVVGGVPLDLLECREGRYSAARARLEFGEIRAEGPGTGERAQLRAAGYWPLQWPDLISPASAPRDLTVTLPRQPLSTLTELAGRAQQIPEGLGGNVGGSRDGLAAFLGALVVTGGDVEGEARLGGTAARPNNAGSFRVGADLVRIRARPEFRPRERWFAGLTQPRPIGDRREELLETGIRDLRLRVELAGNALRLAELRGTSTYGGEFSGSGTVSLGAEGGATAPRVAMSLAVDGFRVVEGNAARLLGEAFQNMELRGNVQSADPSEPATTRPLRLVGTWPNLALTGALRLDSASLPLAFDAGGAGELAALPDVGSLNLTLLAGRGVWIRNSLVRLELEPSRVSGGVTDGALLVTNRLPTPVVAGTLRARNGTFNLPLLRLRNVEGAMRVTYDGRTAQLATTPATPVYLDLSGETSLRIQRSPVLEAEYYDVTFEIRGVPGAGEASGFRPAGSETALAIGAEGGLTVTVRTDPPLPSSEIEALIRHQYQTEGFGTGGANVVEALRGQIEQAFAVNVASELTGRVEDTLRGALGLSIFSVEFGVSQPLRVRLGKRLFGPLYATVAQSFGATELQTQRRFEVYYRVSPQFRVGYREEEPLGRKVFFFSGSAAF